MKRLLLVEVEAGERACGECEHLGWTGSDPRLRCFFFGGKAVAELPKGEERRLPECLAAEAAAKEAK